MAVDLSAIAKALVADGKGILAADETPETLTRRFAARGIPSNADMRRQYREMLFDAPGAAKFISGVILQDETIRQTSSHAVFFARLLTERGMIPGIKVDSGTKPLAGTEGELVTEGLDGLRERLAEYHEIGARFAKWRAVIRIEGDRLPSWACVRANAHALGRYAALAQEQGMLPIVEPEVLMDGSHSQDRCDEVTSQVLQAVFAELHAQGVRLEAMLLKPNMIVAGKECPEQPGVDEVAGATLHCLRRNVPAAVPGIVFLSGGQPAALATAHLDAINRLRTPRPWAISFSYGRALQDPALETWAGRADRAPAGSRALALRAACNGAAARGAYSSAME